MDKYKIPNKKKKPKKKRKVPTCLTNSRCHFCNFCDNTSIHGFKFLGEQDRYLVEKVWWFLVIVFAMYGSGHLIYKTYDKWTRFPVVVTFATIETPIYDIPFPAVTICSEIKFDKKVYNFTRFHRLFETPFDELDEVLGDSFAIDSGDLEEYGFTDENFERYSLFRSMCQTSFQINGTISELAEGLKNMTLTPEFLEDFVKLTYTFEPASCKWLGRHINCKENVDEFLTAEGICKTFNMLDEGDIFYDIDDFRDDPDRKGKKIDKWSLENGYPDGAGLETFPRRTYLSGSRGGFEIVFGTDESELSYSCSELHGFKVTLHHPAEEPEMDKHFRLPLDREIIAGVRPIMIKTADEIQYYDPHKRQCFLEGEKRLSIYRMYTQQNCMTECLTNFTYVTCGCLPFYFYQDGTKEYCGSGSQTCVEEARVTFLAGEIQSKIGNEKVEDILESCDCLPSCTSVEFNTEISQSKWHWKKSYLKTHRKHATAPQIFDHYSKLIVYYKEMQFMTSERHELYGTVDFLANCGGLLGLFCGFSFTSSIEILYYLTLRLWCNLEKFGRKVWSGDPEMLEEEERKNIESD